MFGSAGSMRLQSSRRAPMPQRIPVTSSSPMASASSKISTGSHPRLITGSPLSEQNAKPEVRAAAARRLINFEPTHEGAVRSLMKAFTEMGDRAQAIREFERCRQALLSMLDLLPSQETIAVYEAIRLESPRAGSPVILEGGEAAEARPLALSPDRWEITKESNPAAATTDRLRHAQRR